jgi:hypothetical protein
MQVTNLARPYRQPAGMECPAQGYRHWLLAVPAHLNNSRFLSRQRKSGFKTRWVAAGVDDQVMIVLSALGLEIQPQGARNRFTLWIGVHGGNPGTRYSAGKPGNQQTNDSKANHCDPLSHSW